MIGFGNQGKVIVTRGLAIKQYYGNSEISSLSFFLFEVENLQKISKFDGELFGFQLPVLYQYDCSELTIYMSAVDLRKPYIIDFCPMIRSRLVFGRFLNKVFVDYVITTHGIEKTYRNLQNLTLALITLALQCEIYYTDPRPGNVKL